MHKKRINDILIDSNVLISCSNDKTVKLFDLSANKPIKSFNTNSELFSLAKIENILVVGGESRIFFYDLNKLQHVKTFEESHNDDVTKVRGHPL